MFYGQICTQFCSISRQFWNQRRKYCVAAADLVGKNFQVNSSPRLPVEKIRKKVLKKMMPNLLNPEKLYVSVNKQPKTKQENLKLTFLYDLPTTNEDGDGKNEQVSFFRANDSNLASTYERMSIKLNELSGQKKSRKMKKPKIEKWMTPVVEETIPNLFPIENFATKNRSGEVLDSKSVQNSAAFLLGLGHTFHIGDRVYEIVSKVPFLEEFKISQRMIVGFPIMPTVDIVDGSVKLSSFYWLVENNPTTYSEETKHIRSSFAPKDDSTMAVDGFTLKGTNFFYTPSTEDVGKRICLICVPRNETTPGIPIAYATTTTVENFDEDVIWSERHLLCKQRAPNDILRIVDYNVLASLYLDLDKLEQKDLFFPYCPIDYQRTGYRYPLLLREILGYNGDLLCLQECETKLWMRYLKPFLTSHGYAGTFMRKGGEVTEGSATFYQPDKLELIETADVIVSKLIKENNAEGYEDLASVCKQDAVTETLFVSRPAVLQINLFRCLTAENTLSIVCNTHLHFHPQQGHIRLLQAAVCLRYISKYVEKIKQKHGASKIGIIFCGDFNSKPDGSVYQMMTSGQLKSDDKEWLAGSTESLTFKGVDFNVPFRLRSACCPVEYTNFTGANGFRGCLDYIFINDDVFDVVRRFPMPKHELVEKFIGLPSKICPSDHLPLVCELNFR